jgi:hypothetical protein
VASLSDAIPWGAGCSGLDVDLPTSHRVRLPTPCLRAIHASLRDMLRSITTRWLPPSLRRLRGRGHQGGPDQVGSTARRHRAQIKAPSTVHPHGNASFPERRPTVGVDSLAHRRDCATSCIRRPSGGWKTFQGRSGRSRPLDTACRHAPRRQALRPPRGPPTMTTRLGPRSRLRGVRASGDPARPQRRSPTRRLNHAANSSLGNERAMTGHNAHA